MKHDHVQAYIDYFTSLDSTALERLGDYFSSAARFVDPFNDVRGHAAIRRVFEHMFAHCEAPRFTVDERVGDAGLVYLRWRMDYGRAGARRTLEGVSRVVFDSDGRVLEHIDYWDPARQLYETLPLIGALARALRRRLSATRELDRNEKPRPKAATQRYST
jgi:ketosteroid isomerase-like protein